MHGAEIKNNNRRFISETDILSSPISIFFFSSVFSLSLFCLITQNCIRSWNRYVILSLFLYYRMNRLDQSLISFYWFSVSKSSEKSRILLTLFVCFNQNYLFLSFWFSTFSYNFVLIFFFFFSKARQYYIQFKILSIGQNIFNSKS